MPHNDLVKRLREDQPVTQDWASTAQCALQDEAADRIAALESEVARLRGAMQEADDAITIEINPSNYDHDDVCRLNMDAVNAGLILRDALQGDKP